MNTRRTNVALTALTLTGLALALFTMTAKPAQAQFINASPTGLSSPAATITFNEASPADNALLTNQFAAEGVTFDGGLHFTSADDVNADAGAAVGFSGSYVDNVDFTSQTITPGPYDIVFSAPVTEAAFAAADQGGNFTFTALSGGSVVDTATATIGFATQPDQGFFGFANETFDTIQITNNNGGVLALDTLQFTPAAITTTPEPASYVAFAMGGFGLLGLTLKARKRS